MNPEATESAAPAAAETTAPPPVPDLIERPPAETATPAQAESSPATEAPADSAPQAAEPKRSAFPKEAIDQLSQLRARERQAKAEAEQERQGRIAAQQMLERIAAQQQTQDRQQWQQLQQPQPNQADIQRYAQYQVFLEKVTGLRSEGLRQYGADFQQSINTLNAVGADADDFVHSVMEVAPGHAHELLHELAQDPGRAAALVGMTPVQRIAELARMSSKPAPPSKSALAAATVSKAPAPAPRVQPSTTTERLKSWANSDKMSESEFNSFFAQRMKERAEKRGSGFMR
jgi:hypothetical protein